MKQKKGRKAGLFLLLALLAVFCVLTAELVVCSIVDRPLFDDLTGPFRSYFREKQQAAGVYAMAVREELADQARQRQEKEREASEAAVTPEEVLPERQEAGEAKLRGAFVQADPSVTELVEVRSREYLTGGNLELLYFNQSDPLWAEQPFGEDPIGTYGCGPTALAMAVSSLRGEVITPAEMAVWASEQGYACPGSGSYHSIVRGTAEAFGLDCVSLADTDAEGLLRELGRSGGLMVGLMGPGHFTRGGHFILLHGVAAGGGVLVADPYSRERSLTVWDAQTILDELSWYRDSGAPLWLLTAPPAEEAETAAAG